jgi:hypothetical protein
MRSAWVVVVVAIGCGESKQRTAPVCEKIRDLCDADAVEECPTDGDLAEAEKRVGKRAIENYFGCVRAADSCMQVVGCVGGLGNDIAGEMAEGLGQVAADGAADVRYVDVDAGWSADSFGGHALAVTIEVELTAEPGIGPSPYVTVEARCDHKVDDADASFMELSDLRRGQRRLDTVELFAPDDFRTPPRRCDLTLTLVRGASDPQRFCVEGETVRPDRCT